MIDLQLFGSTGDTVNGASAREAGEHAFENDDVMAALDRSSVDDETLAALDRSAVVAAKPVGEEEGIDATPGAEDETGEEEVDDAPAPAGGETPAPAGGEPVGTTPAPASAKPAAAMDEVLDLGNGMQMSRAVIMQTVSNAARITDEANTFREVFNMSAAEAKTQWAPLLDKMRQDEPFRVGLQAWIEQYVAANPGAPIAEVAADPAKRPITENDAVAAAERVVTNREQQRALEVRVVAEANTLKQKFPALQDPTVWGMFANQAYQRTLVDPNWTLTRAAEEAAATLTRIAKGFMPAEAVIDETIAKPKPAHAASATIGGNGAAPRGTRSGGPTATEEVAFDDLDDSVKDWLKVRGSLGFTD